MKLPRFGGQMGIGGSGSQGQLMKSFEADRREVADRRVATAGIGDRSRAWNERPWRASGYGR